LGAPGAQRLEALALRGLEGLRGAGGPAAAPTAAARGALRRAVDGQLHRLLGAQHGAGLGPRDEDAVVTLRLEDAAGQQLPDRGAPFLLRELLADAPHAQLVVAGGEGALVLPAQQHVDHLTGAEALAALPL